MSKRSQKSKASKLLNLLQEKKPVGRPRDFVFFRPQVTLVTMIVLKNLHQERHFHILFTNFTKSLKFDPK